MAEALGSGRWRRDCLIAYGASMVLKDRLLDEADKTEIYVCEKCGLIAYYDAKQRQVHLQDRRGPGEDLHRGRGLRLQAPPPGDDEPEHRS